VQENAIVLPDMRNVGPHQYQIAILEVTDVISHDPLSVTFFHPNQFAQMMKVKGRIKIKLINTFNLNAV
jgi:hypothetical protein